MLWNLNNWKSKNGIVGHPPGSSARLSTWWTCAVLSHLNSWSNHVTIKGYYSLFEAVARGCWGMHFVSNTCSCMLPARGTLRPRIPEFQSRLCGERSLVAADPFAPALFSVVSSVTFCSYPQCSCLFLLSSFNPLSPTCCQFPYRLYLYSFSFCSFPPSSALSAFSLPLHFNHLFSPYCCWVGLLSSPLPCCLDTCQGILKNTGNSDAHNRDAPTAGETAGKPASSFVLKDNAWAFCLALSCCQRLGHAQCKWILSRTWLKNNMVTDLYWACAI